MLQEKKIKKLLMVLALSLLLSFDSMAQDWKYGVVLGPQLSTVGSTPASRYRVGYHLGFYGNTMFLDNFTIQPEIHYSLMGHGFRTGDLTVINRINLGYISIPVMLNIPFGESGAAIQIGPQIGFLAHANEVFRGDFDNFSENRRANYRNFDYGAAVGMIYELNDKIHTSVRYYLGLSDTRPGGGGVPLDVLANNQALMISFGYALN